MSGFSVIVLDSTCSEQSVPSAMVLQRVLIEELNHLRHDDQENYPDEQNPTQNLLFYLAISSAHYLGTSVCQPVCGVIPPPPRPVPPHSLIQTVLTPDLSLSSQTSRLRRSRHELLKLSFQHKAELFISDKRCKLNKSCRANLKHMPKLFDWTMPNLNFPPKI